jgi:DNA replicative helicase MCM subunit Mcm2 (Cdc46/Mcm family)
MKKRVTKFIHSTEEVSIETAVNDFFDADWNPRDWEETEEFIDQYIEDDFITISDEEKNQLRLKIKEEYDKRIAELKQKEIDQLKDRKSILELIAETIIESCYDAEEVGYLLSAEEILDLIIKNGNK